MKLNSTLLSSSLKKNERGHLILDLSKRNLGSIMNAHELTDPKKISFFFLSNNYFRDIPSNISLFEKLVSLDLSGNNIAEINSLENLANLQSLNLSLNRIKILKNVNSLQNLIKLVSKKLLNIFQIVLFFLKIYASNYIQIQ